MITTQYIDSNPFNHPAHYNQHPSGVECIQIIEHFNFNLGSAMKYIWRAGLKSENPIEDLKKASWYVDKEIQRLMKEVQIKVNVPLTNMRVSLGEVSHPTSMDNPETTLTTAQTPEPTRQVPIPGGKKPATIYYKNPKRR